MPNFTSEGLLTKAILHSAHTYMLLTFKTENMKRLVFAMLCLTLGTGAFAADSKSTKPADKVEVKATDKKVILVGTKEMKASQFRIQRMITTQDLCGNHINVWVSGPHGTTWLQMYDVALDYVVAHLDSNGCFQG